MISNFHKELCLQFASTYAVSKSKSSPWAYFRDVSVLSDEFLGQRKKTIKLKNSRGHKSSLGFDIVAARSLQRVFPRCATSFN